MAPPSIGLLSRPCKPTLRLVETSRRCAVQQATAPLSVKRKLAAILSADVGLQPSDGGRRGRHAPHAERVSAADGRAGRRPRRPGRRQRRGQRAGRVPSAVEAVCGRDPAGACSPNGELLKDRRLEFRIGINLGDVMVEGDDLFGDGVNVAAACRRWPSRRHLRLRRHYDQIKGKLPFGADFLGEQTVKNIAEPVRVYRLRSDRATVRRGIPRRWRTWLAIAAQSACSRSWLPALPGTSICRALSGRSKRNSFAAAAGQALDRRAALRECRRRCPARVFR